ncbi:uncharacterized protein LOC142345371 [Convolutriloba macropyga]|uniref:uncharacterized protein LOC142345371 n=1 Tax=Convolutriloba macropyga TaxID=536237 RepID=UPI003F528A1A
MSHIKCMYTVLVVVFLFCFPYFPWIRYGAIITAVVGAVTHLLFVNKSKNYQDAVSRQSGKLFCAIHKNEEIVLVCWTCRNTLTNIPVEICQQCHQITHDYHETRSWHKWIEQEIEKLETEFTSAKNAADSMMETLNKAENKDCDSPGNLKTFLNKFSEIEGHPGTELPLDLVKHREVLKGKMEQFNLKMARVWKTRELFNELAPKKPEEDCSTSGSVRSSADVLSVNNFPQEITVAFMTIPEMAAISDFELPIL